MTYQSSLVEAISRHSPSQVVLSDGEHVQLTVAELLHAIEFVSNEFRNHGVRGLALVLDNSPAYVVASLAALDAGIWTLPIPPFFTTSQMRNALRQTGCSVILTETASKSSMTLGSISVAGRQLWLQSCGPHKQGKVHEGTALVTFTSGSTGAPKGLCLSEENLLDTAITISDNMRDIGIDRHLSLLPLSILLESVAGVYAALYSGVECIVPSLDKTGMSSKPVPDFKQLVQQLAHHQINSCILVPELLKGLLQQQGTNPQDLSRLRFVAVGGGRVDPNLLQVADRLAIPVYEGYGLSEAGSVVALNLPGQYCSGSTGRLLAHHKVVVSDEGEILLGKAAFLGYCGDLEIPAVPFSTGDIGHLDDAGYLWIQGRKKNVLITSMGRNVSPEWVETSLTARGLIQQAFVHGDGQLQLSALIVSDQSATQIAELIDQVNSSLPDYAQVGSWQLVPAFTIESGTLTGTGKLRRSAIADRYCSKPNISLIA